MQLNLGSNWLIMKVLVFVTSLLSVAYSYPTVAEISGSYLPGVSGGSRILSTVGGSSFGLSGLEGFAGLGGSVAGGYNGAVNDQRHVYFFSAPDDEAPARFRVNIAPSAARNTKIIFVKAPSSGGVIPEVIAPPSQTEDKTLVYVLVKKQDHGGSVTIPSSLGIRQAKPEVYFIKYRNQQEAEQAVLAGASGQGVGEGLSDLGTESNFFRTLTYGGLTGIGSGGILGGHGLSSGGSSLLGATVGSGVPGGVFGSSGTTSVRYGTPGASGPY